VTLAVTIYFTFLLIERHSGFYNCTFSYKLLLNHAAVYMFKVGVGGEKGEDGHYSLP
jgi:hypothetical protein